VKPREFYLEDQMNGLLEPGEVVDSFKDFYGVCSSVYETFQKQWEESGEYMEELLDIQKKAIMGYPEEVAYFIGKIETFLKEEGKEQVLPPPWYENLSQGIYHENWGMGSLAQWFSSSYKNSGSAKIIGERIYFLEEGKLVLKKQKMSAIRRAQLIRALLLLKPRERATLDFHELYLLDGTRVTIFKGEMVKPDQDVIIFRRYIIPRYTFEEQSQRGTIPNAAIPLFKAMVVLGFNVAFLGAVRTSKTTFLSTWQSYEDPGLEGVLLETDPEIPLHQLMPGAPIIQLLADQERLTGITKNLMRSDGDYIIMGEAREGIALDTLLRITSKGTRRVKITYHSGDPKNFPYDVAAEIVRSFGGDFEFLAQRVAGAFDFLFHFVQLKEKNQKRLNSIYEMSYDPQEKQILFSPLCSYRPLLNRWVFYNHVSEEKANRGILEAPEAWKDFSENLAELAQEKGGVR